MRRLNKPVLTEPTIIPPKSLVGGGDTEAKKNNDSSADGSVSKNGAGGNKAIEVFILNVFAAVLMFFVNINKHKYLFKLCLYIN